MKRQIKKLRFFLERHGFYVSSRLADRIGIKAKWVRLFFIYSSFATFGAGFVGYLILAFWLRLKDLIWVKRSSVFDL